MINLGARREVCLDVMGWKVFELIIEVVPGEHVWSYFTRQWRAQDS